MSICQNKFGAQKRDQGWKFKFVSHYPSEDEKCYVSKKNTLVFNHLREYSFNSYYVPGSVLDARLQQWPKTLWYSIYRWTSLWAVPAPRGVVENVVVYLYSDISRGLYSGLTGPIRPTLDLPQCLSRFCPAPQNCTATYILYLHCSSGYSQKVGKKSMYNYLSLELKSVSHINPKIICVGFTYTGFSKNSSTA